MKILVVDDNVDFCSNLKDISELLGYQTICAHAAFRGLELIAQERPDLVLLDVKMPEMDGVEALHEIRKIAPDLPVVMVSGFTEEELVGQALRAGAVDFLSKPVDLDKLHSLIDRVKRKEQGEKRKE